MSPVWEKDREITPCCRKTKYTAVFWNRVYSSLKKTELLATRYLLRQWGSVATQAVNGQGSREACPILSTKKQQSQRALQEFQGMPFLISSLNKNRYSLLPTLQHQWCPSCTEKRKLSKHVQVQHFSRLRSNQIDNTLSTLFLLHVWSEVTCHKIGMRWQRQEN